MVRHSQTVLNPCKFEGEIANVHARQAILRGTLGVSPGARTRASLRPGGNVAPSVAADKLLHRGLMDGRDFRGDGDVPDAGARSAAAQFAEVEVDLETGQVRVIRLVDVQDVGRAINPTLVEGQIEGGAYQGLGYALTEDLIVDPDTGLR